MHPTGFRILIDPEDPEEVTDGGIVLPEQVTNKEKAAVQVGVIVEIGPTAWKSFDDGHPWASVGDRVVFAKYGTKRVEDPVTHKEYVISNDEDILAVL